MDVKLRKLGVISTGMMNYDFERHAGHFLVRIEGKLSENEFSELLLQEIEDEVLEDELQNFLIDLSQVEFIDSGGINVLLAMLTRSRISGGETVLAKVNDQVGKVLLITKLQSIFTVFDSAKEASNHFEIMAK